MPNANAAGVGHGDPIAFWVAYYDLRYGLTDEFEKLTDNHGEGFEPLYGTRNFRTILKGVAYRGGANNSFRREDRRDNRNPLPDDGLTNLCEEGFGRSYYLYETNFDSARTVTTCGSGRDSSHTLRYFQRSPTNPRDTYEMLRAIHETIRNYKYGPIYLHCWNGWHASGLIAAKVLRQFCGFSGEEAVAYWDRNTDGHNAEPAYEKIRQQIRSFQPYPEFQLDSADQALICPAP